MSKPKSPGASIIFQIPVWKYLSLGHLPVCKYSNFFQIHLPWLVTANNLFVSHHLQGKYGAINLNVFRRWPKPTWKWFDNKLLNFTFGYWCSISFSLREVYFLFSYHSFFCWVMISDSMWGVTRQLLWYQNHKPSPKNLRLYAT